jgi:hypothetical protein
VNTLDLSPSGRACLLAPNPAPQPDREVAYIAQKGKEFEDTSGEAAPVKSVGIGGKAREIGFVVVVFDQPLSRETRVSAAVNVVLPWST